MCTDRRGLGLTIVTPTRSEQSAQDFEDSPYLLVQPWDVADEVLQNLPVAGRTRFRSIEREMKGAAGGSGGAPRGASPAPSVSVAAQRKRRRKQQLRKPISQPDPTPAEDEVWQEGTTTVMVKNIPNRYMSLEFLSELAREGFAEAIDFFYLPIDFKKGRNLGYAFVNFCNPSAAANFKQDFEGRPLQRYSARKSICVSRAHFQGKEANQRNIARKCPHRIKNKFFCPVFRTSAATLLQQLKEAECADS